MLEKSFVQDSKSPKMSLEEIIKKKDYKELSNHLSEGIKDYVNSETFLNYLNFISRFHKYSRRNIQLILGQNVNATQVAGYQAWKKMNRNVKKGSKAIYVYAPFFKDKIDGNGNKVTDKNGEIVKETRYFLTPVFDVSQTDGEELPKQLYDLNGKMNDDPQTFIETLKALMDMSPVPVRLQKFTDDEVKGYYDLGNKEIVIRENLGEVMTIKTLLHEITHATLHTNSNATFGDNNYRRQEFEAESVAYIVSNHLGLDVGNYSFGYLSSWTKQGNKLEELSDSLDIITAQAKIMIDNVDSLLNKVYTLDAPKNKFEERVAIAKGRKIDEPRQPKKEFVVDDPKEQRPTPSL